MVAISTVFWTIIAFVTSGTVGYLLGYILSPVDTGPLKSSADDVRSRVREARTSLDDHGDELLGNPEGVDIAGDLYEASTDLMDVEDEIKRLQARLRRE